ncbi:hypothetical protein DFJ58DRAFT_793203 [Suillus subalutaceus]|uniref:uncharacterized protein n=1 Tax=Suillus subalutaceus TaxID=48586 RepID=UPI001B85CA19|nr:uncharacterized protein DFJ58DRAFT_793203 [Suillus subalutaceus]KAG1850818.1 hypothetical protein DFJ58DRAFT_793203 [Suillus subalutaceus]
MFNALTGLGRGGQVDTRASESATCALYATYAFFGFFSGQHTFSFHGRLVIY